MPFDLGNLERQDPRSIWTNEARDFTPWLCERIDALGEVLGMDLEVVRAESECGDFSIDILARDLSGDRLVVIENQLEQTDHSHLGQVITYAAGVEAGVVVWVTPEFRDEHRQAIDWLNRGLGGTTQFFAVAVEILRIDGSKPAVNFRLVAKPPGHRTSGSRAGSDRTVSDKGQLYQAFFQRLIDELREKHHFTNAKAAQPQNWYTFASGVRGFVYSMSFASGGRLRAELYIDVGTDEQNLATLETLRQDSSAIEKEFGEALTWEELDNRRACRIATYRPGSIHDSQEKQNEYLTWCVTRLLKLKAVFDRRIRHVAQELTA